MEWPKKCTSVRFDQACAEYDNSEIENVTARSLEDIKGKIFISSLKRSLDTAKLLFPNQEYFEMKDLREVPLKSFRDSDRMYPLWLWNF